MSQTLAEGQADLNQNNGNRNQERINWFVQTFPRFFTPQVIANRGLPLPPEKEKVAVREIYLTRKICHGHESPLRVERVGDYIRLVCKKTVLEWRVATTQFRDAASMPAEWVGIRVGDQTLTLRRSEVLIAARSLGLFTT